MCAACAKKKHTHTQTRTPVATARTAHANVRRSRRSPHWVASATNRTAAHTAQTVGVLCGDRSLRVCVRACVRACCFVRRCCVAVRVCVCGFSTARVSQPVCVRARARFFPLQALVCIALTLSHNHNHAAMCAAVVVAHFLRPDNNIPHVHASIHSAPRRCRRSSSIAS